jgi:hypothetical protein
VYRGDETRRDEHHQPADPEPKQRRTSKSDHYKDEPKISKPTIRAMNDALSSPCGPFGSTGPSESI